MIVNIAVNARDAMLEGGRRDARIEISTSNVGVEAVQAQLDPAITQRQDVRLAIADNGVGIDPQILSLIWEPFFTTKAPGSGVGLGLATVFGIVRQAGGHVHVDSKPGNGATFMVDLPAVDAAPAMEQPAASAKPEPPGRETILVVEDEPAVLGFATQLLERKGYRVLRASNGKEAIDISLNHQGHIDLLFSDIVMPGLSGHDAALAIREHRPATRVLLTSGYSEQTNCQSGMQLEVPFLPKPYSTQDLLGAVRDAINGQTRDRD